MGVVSVSMVLMVAVLIIAVSSHTNWWKAKCNRGEINQENHYNSVIDRDLEKTEESSTATVCMEMKVNEV